MYMCTCRSRGLAKLTHGCACACARACVRVRARVAGAMTTQASHMAGKVELAMDDASLGATVCPIERLHAGSAELPRFATVDELVTQRGGSGALQPALDADGGETAFGQYAEAVCEELVTQFRATTAGIEKATYIGVFGHATLVNAVAHAVACAAGCGTDALDALIAIELGEAEGILVPLYGMSKSAIHLKRPT